MRFDIIVIGSGAAGLSTAIQLARYNHSVLVFDGGEGRTSWVPRYHNLLGYPQGISGKELLRLGREQAQLYGAEIVKSQVGRIERTGDGDFTVTTSSADYRSRYLVFATGLTDNQPEIPNRYEFAGRSLYYCLDCNGFEFIGQKAAVLGHSSGTIRSAFALLDYTHHVFIATNGHPLEGREEYGDLLKEYKIDVIETPVERFQGTPGGKGKLKALSFQDGSVRDADVALSTYGTQGNSKLAQELNVAVNETGHIVVNEFMETAVPHIYAVGDVINTTQMLVFAISEGVKAAMMIHRSIESKRQPFQA
ncbi:thioredoxin reductase, putative [Heliomicrobium modesticaldum Ice1]|uniref:Thioredoxin reductase, putative n=1 Tax=Heliobacterium modesticaldum (strain ATCC 51547 / Ice1) TaxID=498761 RepID=B0THU8_HELMI|nr:NAD(P)/FAD-dependent oxidoreductase [Heliomicrobium modesticaldum]ABZ84881.1 thioredoxin reductase, putative [Heliomicrobium modesticaldum Ice1]